MRRRSEPSEEVMLFFVTVLLMCFCIVAGVIETVIERGWQDSEFRLTCRQLTSHIAVMEAQFTSIADKLLQSNISATSSEADNVRLAINQRCSGRNHCSFILHADCPESKYWGPGEMFIKYACMPEERIVRFCNLEVTIPEGGGAAAQGFVMSPGYPKFYVGQSECRWRIRAPPLQRVELTLLDVSLSGSNGGGDCEDILTVTDGDVSIFTTCDEQERAPVLLSNSDVLDVAVLGRPGSLVPKRGVLLRYKAIECPTLIAPQDGYLVHRNTSAAEYRCCVGFVFPDTGSRARTLRCLHNRWDQFLPTQCVNLQNVSQIEEVTYGQSNMTESSNLVGAKISRNGPTFNNWIRIYWSCTYWSFICWSFIYWMLNNRIAHYLDKISASYKYTDIIIPSILIAGLLVGNAVIVFIIYQYRKRKNFDIQEEELNTMVGDTANNVP